MKLYEYGDTTSEIKLNLIPELIDILEDYREHRIKRIEHRNEQLYKDLVKDFKQHSYEELISRMIIEKGIELDR